VATPLSAAHQSVDIECNNSPSSSWSLLHFHMLQTAELSSFGLEQDLIVCLIVIFGSMAFSPSWSRVASKVKDGLVSKRDSPSSDAMGAGYH
jgi:hypothetical protein